MGCTTCTCIGHLEGKPLTWSIQVVDPECLSHGVSEPQNEPLA